MSVAGVRRELDRHGLLLVNNPVLPSVAGIVAREPVKGSWWSHPASHPIYAVLERLDDAEDTLLVKLISGKQTFVAKTRWRDFFSAVTAKERWQTEGLSREDRSLLRRVESAIAYAPQKARRCWKRAFSRTARTSTPNRARMRKC